MNKKVALAAGAGVLTVGLLGGAALAAFAPVSDDPVSEVQAQLGATAAQDHPAGDKLKDILDGLIAKGVITQAQADAILAAVKDAAPKHDGDALKRIYANLLEESAQYLGMSLADLKAKLPGSSLKEIANNTSGKSRDGLVAHLTNAANTAIDKALADGKITKDQADKAKAEAPKHIGEFVDHVYPQRTAAGRGPKVGSFIGDVFGVARDYLGLSQREIMQGLKDGKSLGEIANATPNKNRDGLIAAFTGAANAKIDKAKADGKITADQATDMKSKVNAAVVAIVDRKGHGSPKH